MANPLQLAVGGQRPPAQPRRFSELPARGQERATCSVRGDRAATPHWHIERWQSPVHSLGQSATSFAEGFPNISMPFAFSMCCVPHFFTPTLLSLFRSLCTYICMLHSTLSLYIYIQLASSLPCSSTHTVHIPHHFLHLALPHCEFITQVIYTVVIPPQFQVIQHTQVYTIDLLCHFFICNSTSSQHLFIHFHHAPYSYYTHAAMSSTTRLRTTAANHEHNESSYTTINYPPHRTVTRIYMQINLSSQCIHRYLIPCTQIPPSIIKMHSSVA